MSFDLLKYDNQLITKKYGRIKSIQLVNTHPEGIDKTIMIRVGKKKRKPYKIMRFKPPQQFTVIKT